jgi:phage portal protein BeeE
VSLRDRLADAWRALSGKSAGGGVVPNWPEALLRHPYRLDALDLDHAKAVRLIDTIRACVMQRAEDIAAQPVIFERETSSGWEPIEREPGNIVDVWFAGNPRQTGAEVVRDLHANYKVHGRVYLVAETFGMKLPSELWVLPSHLVRVIPGQRRMPSSYVFQRGAEEEIPAKNVIAWHDFQPEDVPQGASPLDALQLQYETGYDLMRLFQKIVRNGGSAAGYFRVNQPSNGAPISLSAREKDAVAKELRKMRSNADLPVILDLLAYDRMGLTMQEIQLIEGSGLSDAKICRVLGVPPWMIGVKDTGKLGDSGSGAQSDERIYWQRLKKECDLRDGILTERLVPMFGEEGIRVRTDFSSVPALNAPLLNAAQQAAALCGRAPLTVNEVRALSGLTKVDDPEADTLYVAPVVTPFGGGDEPKKEAPEPKPAAKAKRLIDTPERAERWREKDRLISKYERKFEREFVSLIRERKAKILRGLEAQGLRAMQAKRTIDLDAIFAPDEGDEAAIQAIYERLIAERGAEAAREIALELEVNLKNQSVRQFIKARQTVGLEGAMDTLLADVRIQLAEGIGLNESLSELAARVSTYLEDAEQGRVLTIARTETVSAFNFATREAWAQSGEVEEMEWLSARDSAVREAHANADGQTARLAEGFDVGGETLAYPGDP